MSLAADTARTASNMNKSLTLDYFIHALEAREREQPAERQRVGVATLLDMIHAHLSDLENIRRQVINRDRIAREALATLEKEVG